MLACYHLTEVVAAAIVAALVARATSGVGTPRTALSLGVLGGLAALVRPSLAPLGGLFGLLPLAAGGGTRARRVGLAALACGGMAACVLPWTARNRAVTGEFLPLAVGQGYSTYVSARQYAGTISYKITVPEWEA